MSVLGLVAVAAIGLGATAGARLGPASPAKDPKYIGADKCKNCHSSDESGNQYHKWETGPHAKAYATLASDEAKAAGKEKGVDDPQTADQCLKCHVTAFGVADDMIKKGFNKEEGVQCESCHGPGEAHMKARFMAASQGDAGDGPQTVGPGEIKRPDAATCTTCHNDESPSYKGFCYKHFWEKIEHWDPRKEHDTAALEAMECTCEK
jgi:hypothetical protein